MNVNRNFDLKGGLFFAGANSGHGFVSFYDDLVKDSRVSRVYILKGGPGTGKSSFLRSAASRALAKGKDIEFYSCSSDPDSLDAVLIGGDTVILDGTAPHALDAEIPGAREEIVNLGSFWDSERLADKYYEITRLCKAKQESYARAYKYLEAYKKVNDINLGLVLPLFNMVKAEKSVGRIFADIMTGGGAQTKSGIINSIGMKGRVRYDTYERYADKIYVVDDFLSVGHIYLRLIASRASLTDTPLRVSYDPVDTEHPDALFFINDGKAFVISENGVQKNGDERINMRRFIDLSGVSRIRKEYRANKKLAEALLASAEDLLSVAGEYHFALEEIYVSCMDFGAKEKFCNKLLDKIIR